MERRTGAVWHPTEFTSMQMVIWLPTFLEKQHIGLRFLSSLKLAILNLLLVPLRIIKLFGLYTTKVLPQTIKTWQITPLKIQHSRIPRLYINTRNLAHGLKNGHHPRPVSGGKCCRVWRDQCGTSPLEGNIKVLEAGHYRLHEPYKNSNPTSIQPCRITQTLESES